MKGYLLALGRASRYGKNKRCTMMFQMIQGLLEGSIPPFLLSGWFVGFGAGMQGTPSLRQWGEDTDALHVAQGPACRASWSEQPWNKRKFWGTEETIHSSKFSMSEKGFGFRV